MRNSFFRLQAYATHHLRSLISRRGYGIHSPFAFNLVSNIINPDEPSFYYCFDTIERLRHRLRYSKDALLTDKGKLSPIGTITKSSTTPARDGQLLFRIATHMQSENIIELGSSLGIGTAYLASTSRNSHIISIDHNPHVQKIAQQNIQTLGLENVTFMCGTFETTLPTALEGMDKVDFIFFDGHHSGLPTLDYYQKAIEKTHQKSVFIFHDIHWSKGMYEAWKTICKDARNSLTLECYNMGIVFFNPGLHQEHFYV